MKQKNYFLEFFSLYEKIKFFLDKKFRKKVFQLIILLFIGMVLEAFSLTMIVPSLSAIVNPEFKVFLDQNKFLSAWFSDFSDINLISFFLTLLTLVFLIKGLFLVYLVHYQNKFSANFTVYISNKLMQKYLNAKFSFHQKNNSAILFRNLNEEVGFFSSFFQAYMNVFVEFILLISIIVTLILIEPIGALTIGVFLSVSSFIFLLTTKKTLSVLGAKRQKMDGLLSKIILESMQGIKEIKINSKQDFFYKKFSLINSERANINANFLTLNLTPRFYLEFISIISLAGFIIIFLYRGGEFSNLITTVAVFIAATFRMLPSVNKIIASLQVIKYKKHSLDLLISEFKNTPLEKLDEEKNEAVFDKKFEIKDLNFSFDQKKLIFNNASIVVRKGDTVGIVGPSGSGKTTLINIILGLFPEVKAHIYIDKEPLKSVRSWRDKIGYVSQSIFLLDDSIRNNVAFGINSDSSDTKRINNVLKTANLDSFVQNLPNGIETKIGEQGQQISGGQRQRIGLARALFNDSEILIFDEATSALDNLTEKEVIKSILELKGKKTIIMIAHRLTTLKECNVIYELNNGIIKIFDKKIKTKANV